MVTTVDGIPSGGSTGADTYGRNRYGSYIRRRTKPVNPNSTSQALRRGAFAAAVNDWYGLLTPTQRSAWSDWAAATPWLNRAGQSTHLSGQAAYIRSRSFQTGLNSLLAGSIGESATLLPPATPAIGAIAFGAGTVIYDISDTEWNITLAMIPGVNTWADGDANSWCTIGVSPAQSVGRTFKPTRFQQILNPFQQAAADATAVTAIPAASLPFAWSASGAQHVFLQLRGWANTTKQLSEKIVLGPFLTTTQA